MQNQPFLTQCVFVGRWTADEQILTDPDRDKKLSCFGLNVVCPVCCLRGQRALCSSFRTKFLSYLVTLKKLSMSNVMHNIKYDILRDLSKRSRFLPFDMAAGIRQI